ncbi:hypothetical protein BGZ57DRAFT_403716 [Hyaloscypha finlandica]|nr:hypothetical protein BGZ57DRAFT_403716 [Hyaloscypha finlandica]
MIFELANQNTSSCDWREVHTNKDFQEDISHTSQYAQWCESGGTLIFRELPTQAFAASVLQIQTQSIQEPSRRLRYFPLYFQSSSPDSLKAIPELIAQIINRLVRDTAGVKVLRDIHQKTGDVIKAIKDGGHELLFNLAELTIKAKLCVTMAFGIDYIDTLGDVHQTSELYGTLFKLCKIHPKVCRVVASTSSSYDIADLGPLSSTVRELAEDTEYQECLRCLYFDRQYTRREEIADPDPGTTEWIWSHKSYLGWRQQERGILWIQGKPGCGKSVLAKRILAHEGSHRRPNRTPRNQRLSSDENVLVCDWFYSTRGGEVLMAHRSLLQSLLYQLLQQSAPLFCYFKVIYRRHAPLSKDWITVEYMLEILRAIAAAGVRAIFVVDGMDESEDANTAEQGRRAVLSQFSYLVSEIPRTKMKFLVLSRPSPDIEQHFWRHYQRHGNLNFVIFEHENADDIRKIIKSGMRSLRRAMHPFRDDHDLPSEQGFSSEKALGRKRKKPRIETTQQRNAQELEEKECQKMKCYLEEHAQGVILWVTVILAILKTEIESGVYTFRRLHEKMKDLPIDLASLYSNIIKDLASRLDNHGRNLARKALMWVSGANTLHTITVIQLREALAIPDNAFSALVSEDNLIEQNLVPVDDWTEFRHQLRKLCGPLIEIIIPTSHRKLQQTEEGDNMDEVLSTDRVQLLHRTVKDFLADSRASKELSFTGNEAIQKVRDDCHTYLALVLPKEPSSYAPVPPKPDTFWIETADNVVEYIENRVLLQFILLVFPGELSTNTIIQSIFDEPIRPAWKPSTQLEQDLRICTFFRNRPSLFIPKGNNYNLSRKAVSAELIRRAFSKALTQALPNLFLVIKTQMIDWMSDRDFIGYLVHLLLLATIENRPRDFPHDSFINLLTELIHGDTFPEWNPRCNPVWHSFQQLTFMLSPYELASANVGDEYMAGRMFDLMETSLHRDQMGQRPSKELFLEMTRTISLDHRGQEPFATENIREMVQLASNFIVVTYL